MYPVNKNIAHCLIRNCFDGSFDVGLKQGHKISCMSAATYARGQLCQQRRCSREEDGENGEKPIKDLRGSLFFLLRPFQLSASISGDSHSPPLIFSHKERPLLRGRRALFVFEAIAACPPSPPKQAAVISLIRYYCFVPDPSDTYLLIAKHECITKPVNL